MDPQTAEQSTSSPPGPHLRVLLCLYVGVCSADTCVVCVGTLWCCCYCYCGPQGAGRDRGIAFGARVNPCTTEDLLLTFAVLVSLQLLLLLRL